MKAALYQHTLDNSAWGKLYPAVLWRDVRYREGSGYEDLDSFYLLFSRAREVRVSPLRLYLYTIRPTSYLRRFSARRADVLDVTDRIVAYMHRNMPELEDAARSRALSANFNILRLIESNRASVEYHHIVDRCRTNIRSLRRRCLFDSGVRMKNKAAILLSYLGLRLVEALFRVLPPAE